MDSLLLPLLLQHPQHRVWVESGQCHRPPSLIPENKLYENVKEGEIEEISISFFVCVCDENVIAPSGCIISDF